MTNLIEFIPAHVREYLQSQGQSINQGIEIIANLEGEDSFIAADMELESREKTAQILRGFLYMRYRETCDRRNFLAFLAKRGIPQRTAYDYIAEAETYARLPDAQACATVAHIGQVKTRLLSQLPDDQLRQFLHGEPVLGFSLDEASTMTKDEFKSALQEFHRSSNAELARANQQIGNLEARLEAAQHNLASVNEALERKFSDFPFPPWVIAVREESTVHGDTALRALEGLSLALQQVKKHTFDSMKGDDLAEYRAAASLVYHQLIGVLAGAKTLVEEAHAFLPKRVVEEFDVTLPLSDAEIKTRLEHRDRIVKSEKVQEETRARLRAAKTQGRGRPSARPEVYPE